MVEHLFAQVHRNTAARLIEQEFSKIAEDSPTQRYAQQGQQRPCQKLDMPRLDDVVDDDAD